MSGDIFIARRTVMRQIALGAVGVCTWRLVAARSIDMLRALEAQTGGRIGVSVLDTVGGGRLVEYRGHERFAMCSTFKWLLAAAILAKVDRGVLSLTDHLLFTRAELLSASPVTTAHVDEGALTIAALCEAAVTVSDNTAANTLLARIGGPIALTEQLRSWGDQMTRLDRNEPSLNTNLPGDPRDTTTPRAMTALMRTLLVEDRLSVSSREQLQRWLRSCRTGLSRIRAGIPSAWQAGDKTGTGAHGAVNDIAILWPPGRAPILVAVYMSGSNAAADVLNAAHAQVGEWVAKEFV